MVLRHRGIAWSVALRMDLRGAAARESLSQGPARFVDGKHPRDASALARGQWSTGEVPYCGTLHADGFFINENEGFNFRRHSFLIKRARLAFFEILTISWTALASSKIERSSTG